MPDIDVIIIGSGQGGVPLAVRLGHQGKSVVLFERSALGGSCLNYGCYPSKSFLGAAFSLPVRDHAASWGVEIESRVDFTRLMGKVRGKRDSGYIKEALKRAGVRIVYAEAAFTGKRQVRAGDDSYEAQTVVINTGNGPFVPPIPGLSDTPFMTYLDFWNLDELPARTLILGGGYIGLELGQGLARLGSEIHVVDQAARVSSREEEDVSRVVQSALEHDGVSFHLGRKVTGVEFAGGIFSLSLDGGEELQGEALLVAVGQQANTAALDAAAGGVVLTERGFVRVNNRFETSCPGVYAIGDVTGQPAFTHVSWEDHRRLLSILEGGARRQGDRVLGYAMYTDPEVGRCGLTLDQAESQGINARSATLGLEHVARAWLQDRTKGFYRLVVDDDSGKIIGATLVAPGAGELIHALIDLMEMGAGWQDLERAVHIHPTLAEGLPSLARKLKRT